jgi:hypothetical protein
VPVASPVILHAALVILPGGDGEDADGDGEGDEGDEG